MNRYATETLRLYGWLPAEGLALDRPPESARALVLTFPMGSAWEVVAEVWQGVQTGWGWPAPAIAVDGAGSYQLWFALAHAVSAFQAQVWAAEVGRRWCPSVDKARMGAYPGPVPVQLPGRQVATDQWSAFVAPDLAALFADTPWLDGPPNPDAQADLLARFVVTPPAVLTAQVDVQPPAMQADIPADRRPPRYTDPVVFLTDVMNNPTVDWSARIEAAKVLLVRVP